MIIRYLTKEQIKVAPVISATTVQQSSFSKIETSEEFPPRYQQHQTDHYVSKRFTSPSQGVIETGNLIEYQPERVKPVNADLCVAQAEKEEEVINQNTVAEISTNKIEKAFHESKSVGNFAKKLVFLMFLPEERQGRNCTGRVPGKDQHKGQLDPVKLQAVKNITFRKYTYKFNQIDNIWKRVCIKAIDSALRKENKRHLDKCQQVQSNVRKPD